MSNSNSRGCLFFIHHQHNPPLHRSPTIYVSRQAVFTMKRNLAQNAKTKNSLKARLDSIVGFMRLLKDLVILPSTSSVACALDFSPPRCLSWSVLPLPQLPSAEGSRPPLLYRPVLARHSSARSCSCHQDSQKESLFNHLFCGM